MRSMLESRYLVRSILPIRIYIMYRFDWIENKETKESALIIQEGPYENVIFIFKDGRIILKDENGEPLDLESVEEIPIDFKYEVLYNPNEVDVLTSDFKNALGDIFMTVLQESVQNENYNLVNDENRNDNTEQPDS